MSTVIPVKGYVSQLKKQGLFSLGEPLVRYKIDKLVEKATFFLSHETHGIHAEVSSIALERDSRKVNPILAMSIDNSPTYQILKLADFLDEYGQRFVNKEIASVTQNNEISRSFDKSKSLAKLLSYDVFQRDRSDSETKIASRENLQEMYERLPFSSDNIEKIIYLSRLDCIDTNDAIELIDAPLSLIASALHPSETYSQITMPTTIRASTKTIQRNTIHLSNPI